jgi:alcohol dehydrogenase class IV
MQLSFTYDQPFARIIFGVGAFDRLADEVERLGATQAPEAMRIMADALGAENAARGLFDLAVRIGAPMALKDIGMPAEGLERAAELATQNPYTNPRPVGYAGVLALLQNAYVGRTPGSAADAPVGSPKELL